MDEQIKNLEMKASILSTQLLSSSMNINDDISKLRKDFYKTLILTLDIIQKQKEEIIDLKLDILEKENEIKRKDIMQFCLT